MKGIKLRKSESSTMPWEVYVSKSVFGKKIRKRFENRADAQSQVDLYETKVLNNGRQELDPDLHKLVALYQDKMTVPQFATMLEEGVRRYSVTALPLGTLVQEYLALQTRLFERGSVGQCHINTVNYLAPKLVESLDNPLVRDIDTEMIEEMVDQRLASTNKKGKKVSPRSVRNEVNQLSAIFNYGIGKKYVTDNPTLKVNLPSYKPEVGICQPEDLENLLSHACHYIQCWIMFGAFGGLRSSEIFRMKWSDVRLDEGQFYIEGSKNEGAERWIKMTPPLMDFCKAILEGEDVPSGLVMGGMTSQTQQRKIEAAYKKAGYRIPKNGLRHSFGSHHLVYYQNADNTANEMGHIGPTMTFKAYRKAVLKSQAAS
ncbi:MAG: tyrosine-type recombinase/integrase, partial [Verrucomicrobiota bacterium]|nr:tyrosine-type recombinase/integrase [Verrucomicrobiota bacterium]